METGREKGDRHGDVRQKDRKTGRYEDSDTGRRVTWRQGIEAG